MEVKVGRAAMAMVLLGMILVGVLVVPGLLADDRDGELVFAEESVDLGQVPLNTLAPHRFAMQNVGGKPVTIAPKGKITVLEGC
jgi:hypothetical protein